METPWREGNKSERQERRLAQLPGGRKQVNSGRRWFSKRDVTLREFLVEARTTDKKSYRIDRDEFLDIVRAAMRTPPGKLPAMQIDFETPTDRLSLFVIKLEDHQAREAVIQNLLAEINRLKGVANDEGE